MSHLLAVAERLLIDSAISGNPPFTGRNKAGSGFFVLSGLFLATGLGFMIYATSLWLTAHYAPHAAAAMTGGLALLLALLSASLAYVFLEYKRSRLKKIKAEATATLQTAFELLNKELGEPIRENPKTAILIASLAGFATGEKLL